MSNDLLIRIQDLQDELKRTRVELEHAQYSFFVLKNQNEDLARENDVLKAEVHFLTDMLRTERASRLS
jgi:cell division protein FtsB